jgi:hypothetical protein
MDAALILITTITLMVASLGVLLAWGAEMRADFRERLIWMQTLRNQLRDLPDEVEDQAAYDDRRMWMRTCLRVSEAYGRREELPQTTEIADKAYEKALGADRIELRNHAKRELDRALQREADRHRTPTQVLLAFFSGTPNKRDA